MDRTALGGLLVLVAVVLAVGAIVMRVVSASDDPASVLLDVRLIAYILLALHIARAGFAILPTRR